MNKQLRLDAIATAPWVAEFPGLSMKTLAFIVFHGGGSPEVHKLEKTRTSLMRVGSKKLLSEILHQYGWRARKHEAA